MDDTDRGTKKSLLSTFLPRRPLQWVGVAGVLGLVAGMGGVGVLLSGMGPLSAVPPHPDGWAHLLHFASSRAFAHNASASPTTDEPLTSTAMIMRGAAEYSLVCSDCHGAPGYGQNPVALSMRPEPPLIVDISKKLSADELYYVVKNGVRYTGMPAWPVQNRPDEIWAMVAFIEAMPTMDRASYQRLATGNADGVRQRANLGNVNAAVTLAPGTPKSIAPFVPTNTDRPYLPGDPQEAMFSSPAATTLPRTGYVSIDRGDLAATCVSCHGPDNTGRPAGAFPNLTLQSPQYIYDSLQAFATGQRQSGIMWLVAANLSDEQMRSLALQIGSAPARRTRADSEDGIPSSSQLARGAEIAHAGVASDGGSMDQPNPAPQMAPPAPAPSATPAVERCTSCHVSGSEVDKIIPAIDGQNADYLRTQLRLFRAGGRGDTTAYNPMVDDSKNLTDADITALADYYASVPPRAKP